jgi:hypothetical protein
MKQLYLILAIVGGIAPYVFFFQHFASSGLALNEFVAALFVNGAAGGFTVDLLLSSAVFWIAIIHRHRLGKGPNPIAFVVLNLCIGLCCALPAYLYAHHAREP